MLCPDIGRQQKKSQKIKAIDQGLQLVLRKRLEPDFDFNEAINANGMVLDLDNNKFLCGYRESNDQELPDEDVSLPINPKVLRLKK